MDKNNLKVISLVLMSLLSYNSLWNLLKYFQTKLSMASPLIPDYVIGQFTQPYLSNAVFTALAAALSLPFFFRSMYKLTIGICGLAIIAELFIKLGLGRAPNSLYPMH